MEISITWNICRVCLQEEQKNAKESKTEMRNIFKEDKKLALYIYEFSGIMMQPNDSLPDKICLKCLKIINNAVHFRKTCRASNSYLQSVLERTRSASTLFKPVVPTCEVSDEEDCLEVQMETGAVSESEHSLEEKDTESESNNKKLVYSESSDNLHTLQVKVPEIVENMELLEKTELDDAVSDTAIDLVDVMEHPEDVINDIIEDSTDLKHSNNETEECSNIKSDMEESETLQLQKFYMNARFTKLKNTEEELDNCSEQDMAQNNIEADHSNTEVNQEDELYYLLKDIKNEETNSNNKQEDLEQTEEQSPITDDSVEYFAIEDEEDIGENIEQEETEQDIMLHFETENDDNPAQVSSTVDTNDESEYNEQNSTTSPLISDLEEEYIVDGNFSNYNKEETETKSLNVSGAKINCTIISRRKLKKCQRKTKASTASDAQLKVCVCEICGNQFTNRNLMNLHMKVHYQEKNHQCELCFKRFITACNLQAHMRIHTGEKPFQCRYCGRRFNDRSSSLRHERTHTNEKPFKCSNCGKTFTLATTLQNHLKVHTNERSYRCEPCGKSFKLSHHLKTHQNTSLHHSVVQIGRLEN